MKFFSTSHIRELDKFTIENEPIASIDLMERAARTLYLELLRRVESDKQILVFAGPGNNGGDALALARMLLQSTFSVQVVLLHTGKLSADCKINHQRLLDMFPTALNEQSSHFEAPLINKNTIIIDGLFGSGLTRPLNGIFADAVHWINRSGCSVISIDIPSGLQEEIPLTPNGEQDIIIKANYTFSFQFPKLAFLFPENENFVGEWEVLDIGIHPQAIAKTETPFYFLEKIDIQHILKHRLKFSHKGTYGHALIVAGSSGMAGASVLAGKSALRSGVGLVTVHGPECNRIIVQSAVPELIFHSNETKNTISKRPKTDNFDAIAIGPGIGTSPETVDLLEQLLQEHTSPTVLDADALNIIAQNPHLQEYIQNDYILTPHPKEFERLLGQSCKDSYERMLKASEMAQDMNAIIILKGSHTLIALPDGRMIFNSTGNSGMATAGSGDVLTGILTGLLAQGYTPEETAKLGVFIHGMAGDLAAKTESEESLIASDIITQLGASFRLLKP
jgi:ADP-dependent NAD(P)H-hydrate dehydratase / NAD(P)H-hydrate epimerase